MSPGPVLVSLGSDVPSVWGMDHKGILELVQSSLQLHKEFILNFNLKQMRLRVAFIKKEST